MMLWRWLSVIILVARRTFRAHIDITVVGSESEVPELPSGSSIRGFATNERVDDPEILQQQVRSFARSVKMRASVTSFFVCLLEDKSWRRSGPSFIVTIYAIPK